MADEKVNLDQPQGPPRLHDPRDVRGGAGAARHGGEVASGVQVNFKDSLRHHRQQRSVAASGAISRPTTMAPTPTTTPSGTASSCSIAGRSRGCWAKVAERGLTLVPLRLYFKEGGPSSNWGWPGARSCTTSAKRSVSGRAAQDGPGDRAIGSARGQPTRHGGDRFRRGSVRHRLRLEVALPS